MICYIRHFFVIIMSMAKSSPTCELIFVCVGIKASIILYYVVVVIIRKCINESKHDVCMRRPQLNQSSRLWVREQNI